MTLSDVSIRRPILTWMMTLALVVFGVLGFNRLGVDQFPDIEFPTVTVTARLEGADPEGMEEDVTEVLEERLNTAEGLRSIRSTTHRNTSQVVLEFAMGADLDVAKQEVRDKVAVARQFLPAELDPPIVESFNPSQFPILWIPMSSERPLVETSEYAERQVKPFFESVPGVASVSMFGKRDRNIRIWLDGNALRARGLTATDVLGALRRQHVHTPGGTVESQRIEYTVTTDAEFATLGELERLVVAQADDAPVYLRDVARLEDGAADRRSVAHFNGKPTIGMGISKQPNGNAVAIADEVYRRLDDIRAMLPSGMSLVRAGAAFDTTRGVREAVLETEFALVFGGLLAVLVVFLFLRRTRPTLIVAAAIPISLIATFGLAWLAGSTLNTMTLLAMTLAVGVVIDDAIVVLENIERHRESGANAREAATTGTREITFAAAAATFSVAAVFLPVYFVEGIFGSFLGDFGLTVAGSVMISLFVALTLTPMLAARMPPPAEREHGSIYHRLEQAFDLLESGYRRLLDWTLAHRGLTVGAALGSFALALLCGAALEREFFPPADNGTIMSTLEAPPGTSLDAAIEYLRRDEEWFLKQPEVAGLFSSQGDTGHHTRGTHEGNLFGVLTPRDERERSVHELLRDARAALEQVPGRKIRIFNPASSFGFSRGEFEVEIRGNASLRELDEVSDRMIAELRGLGGFVDLDKSLKLGLPELRVVPDREKAASLGVDAETLARTVQLMIGGMDVGIFKEGGRRYDIRMRLDEESRNDPDEIGRLYARTSSGEVVELRNLIRVERSAAPSAITRSDRQRSVTISSNLQDRTLGEAVEEAHAAAGRVLPEGMTLGLSGQAKHMRESAAQFGVAMVLGILAIYMILAAQFESLVHPLTVMLALPLAMVGALGGLLLFGQTLNLFSLIGIILLFGLVTKNSILLVDYANQLRERGVDRVEAIRRAAPIRMRPVVMTALAMIFGVIPAAVGFGPGSESRAPMAIATACGMFTSTLLTLIVVPVFYLLFDDLAEHTKQAVRRVIGARSSEPARTTAP